MGSFLPVAGGAVAAASSIKMFSKYKKLLMRSG